MITRHIPVESIDRIVVLAVDRIDTGFGRVCRNLIQIFDQLVIAVDVLSLVAILIKQGLRRSLTKAIDRRTVIRYGIILPVDLDFIPAARCLQFCRLRHILLDEIPVKALVSAILYIIGIADPRCAVDDIDILVSREEQLIFGHVV